MRYFNDNFLKKVLNANSAIVARFFFSDREGELQKSHHIMLRSLLYQILDQDEAFFYHCFQSEYRKQEPDAEGHVIWQYDTLKRLLLSLSSYLSKREFYLIIDAMDESEDEVQQRIILNILFDLCLTTSNCAIKVFVASRPMPLLTRHKTKFHHLITLQDETKSDISLYTRSFLQELSFADFLEDAMRYILEHADGVFIWVRLVKEELFKYDERGRCTEKEVFKFLQSLPTGLEAFYERILDKMSRDDDERKDIQKIFRIVLFARRPLSVTELLHILPIPDDFETEFTTSVGSFHECIRKRRYIIHCGGNFLEVRGICSSFEYIRGEVNKP
jgi:hypothetical protein